MAWETQPADDWDEWVSDTADQLENAALHDLMEQFNILPTFGAADGLQGAVHEGALEVAGDFTQPALVTAINGDLTVAGKLSTQGVDGFDGNATLVVFGDLHCGSLVNDWASIIIVTGNCTVTDWCFAAREDSSFVVGGDFKAPVFVGFDIWVNVGGRADLGSGLGYALTLDQDTAEVVARVAQPSANAALKLPVSANDYDFVEALERRLFETGTLLPAKP